MITYRHGNILDDDADALVNPVNCVGVMGAGLAKQFAERWPEIVEGYTAICADGTLRIGGNAIMRRNDGKRVILFPTKQHWRDKSRLGDISTGLHNLKPILATFRPFIGSIAVPALGCGLGGLRWSDVKPLIQTHLGPLDLDVRVYEP